MYMYDNCGKLFSLGVPKRNERSILVKENVNNEWPPAKYRRTDFPYHDPLCFLAYTVSLWFDLV